ncbi:MAG: phosphoribosylanthranilate isomerase [Xanthobacteraceae bacterium]|nr:phosphoribosylanthranilate isomerase [Xanthobacteraceae bacterium]
MTPPLVKICGLSTPDTLDAALGAGADMVGFVFFEPSPRHIGLATARELSRSTGDRAARVALTVDADDAYLAAIVEALRPQVLQLHGRESAARVRDIKARFGLPVMKAIAIETADDLAHVAAYVADVDYILFDARAPKDATRPGGLGRPFDWTILRGLTLPVPFLLSGGLDPDNVARAIAVTRPYGVDVSSGVERAPGVKDIARIRAFVAAAHAASDDAALTPPSTPIASRA